MAAGVLLLPLNELAATYWVSEANKSSVEMPQGIFKIAVKISST